MEDTELFLFVPSPTGRELRSSFELCGVGDRARSGFVLCVVVRGVPPSGSGELETDRLRFILCSLLSSNLLVPQASICRQRNA